MRVTKQSIATCLFAVVALLSGCASTIPPEKQKDYGLLIPAENKSTMISEIDGDTKFGLSGTTYDVLPGQHTIKVTTCSGSSSNCVDRHYTFEVKAGLAYLFRGVDAVSVYNRQNLDTLLYRLVKQPGGNLVQPGH